MFNVVEWLQGRVFLSVIPSWKEMRVLRRVRADSLRKTGEGYTLASVFPPSRSICLLTLGDSSGDFARTGTIFSGETVGVSSGSCWTDGAILVAASIVDEVGSV